MEQRDADIIIAGCGPAGALLAVHLAQMGYHIICVTAAPATPRIEGLGQRTLDVMQRNDLANALAAATQPVLRHAYWGGEAADYNQEYIVSRERLNAGLIADVKAKGVDVIMGRCGAVRIGQNDVAANITISNGPPQQLRARFFVDARGRAAPRTRTAELRGPDTTALTRQVAAESGPCTIVESLKEGWAWYVCNGHQAFLQVFVDSANGLPKRDQIARLHDRFCAETHGIRQRTGALRGFGKVVSRNATTLLSSELMSGRSLRIGDAAAAIDPLSGHGIFAAFGSALAASATINTFFTRPENTELANRFYTDRMRLGALRNARIGRDFYRHEARWAEQLFWQARLFWPDDEAAHGHPSQQNARIEKMPVICDSVIVEEEVIVTTNHPRGVWRVDDVALAPLLKAARQNPNLSAKGLIERAAERQNVEPSQIIAALNWLKTAGVL